MPMSAPATKQKAVLGVTACACVPTRARRSLDKMQLKLASGEKRERNRWRGARAAYVPLNTLDADFKKAPMITATELLSK